MTFIACDNLVKIYKVADLEVVALQGLDLSVEEGEMIALVGPSGSGKSTLMNVLGVLDTPSAGTVRVGDIQLTEMTPRARIDYRRRTVGFIWQQTSLNLLPYLSVRDNVEMPMAFNGLNRRQRREHSATLLEQVGLADRMNTHPAHLSGGEQQRAALAVALANQPELLLADEPTGEVDSEAAAAIFETMAALNRKYGVTIVIVTHDYNVATRVDRVVGMRDGRVSTELLRRKDGSGSGLTPEEFAVLDRTGRLQIPEPFREALHLDNRVRLRLHDDHIGIYPAGDGSEEV